MTGSNFAPSDAHLHPARTPSEAAPDAAPDPSDVILDLWEQATRAAIAIGGEVAMRARLARLLPAPQKPDPPMAALGPMELTQVLAALRAGDGRRWSDGEHAARGHAKSLVLDAITNSRRRT